MMNLNIADNGGASAIVVGDKIQNLDKINLDSIPVEINLNGKVTEPYFKGEKRAGPIEAIKCIINEFKDNPVTFKKGDWFMTGSVIQPFKVNKGDKLKVDFKTLGKNRYRFYLMKVAVVTGSSKGIGSIIAKDLNKRKIKVVLIARSKKLLKKIQENLTYPKISQIIAKDLRSLSACNFVGKKSKKN